MKLGQGFTPQTVSTLSGTSSAALLKRHPTAHALAAYDGTTRIGTIIDTGPRRQAWAFDGVGRVLGAFKTRRLAFAAVSSAYDAETRS
jgi:hypothetical protein